MGLVLEGIDMERHATRPRVIGLVKEPNHPAGQSHPAAGTRKKQFEAQGLTHLQAFVEFEPQAGGRDVVRVALEWNTSAATSLDADRRVRGVHPVSFGGSLVGESGHGVVIGWEGRRA